MDFLSIIQSTTPIEAFLLAIILAYGVYKGIVIIPWIKIGKKGSNPHSNCAHYGDLESIIDEKVKKVHKTYELKKDLIDAQMSAADKSMITIKNMMMDRYKTAKPEGRDLRAYSKVLDYTLNKTKSDKLKQYIIDNHFVEKTDAEFTLYKQTTIKTLQSYHIMCLDEEYYSEDFDMSREDLFNLDQGIMHDIRDELSRLFDEIRDIAIKYGEELKKIEKS